MFAQWFLDLRRIVTQHMHCASMNVRVWTAFLAFAFIELSCGDTQLAARGAQQARPTVKPTPVVIVTIDGVRWQEIFEGTDPTLYAGTARSAAELVPNLYKLGHERGVTLGAPGFGVMAASGPNYVSLPGYNEILSGRVPVDCPNNECPRAAAPTLLDEAYAAGVKVAAFGSWEKLDDAVTARPGTFPVSCGRHGDESVAPWPGQGEYRPDRKTADAALIYYANEQPDVFFLGLGDTDEYAHRGDYGAYVEALHEADAVVGRLTSIASARGADVVVATDHGRSKDFRSHGAVPEAARTWLIAAGPSIAARGAVASPRERHLADLAPTLRPVLGLAKDTSPLAGAPIAELTARN
jgi:hypothetical protein